jgi:hypothetical protein
VFACIATYGLRPHELWHAEGIDSQGWISIPGDMKTKTGEHFAPAIPEAWVERYGLRENWAQFHGQLNARWKVRFAEVSGVKIAVNNVAVSNSLYKEFQRKGLQKLWAPVADGEGMDWVRLMTYGTRTPSAAPLQRRPWMPLTTTWPAGWAMGWMCTGASTYAG